MTLDKMPETPLLRKILRSSDFGRIVILLIVVAGFGLVTHGVIYSARGLSNILTQSSLVGVAAIGQTFVMLTGGIDISMYGVGLLASMVGAALMTSRPDLNIAGGPLPVSVGVFSILVVGSLMGALNGVLVARLRVVALIATLGTWQLGIGLAQIVGGGYTITNLPPTLSLLGQGEIAGAPVPIIIMVILFVIAHALLTDTQFGRALYAVGGNKRSAFISGINVSRVIFAAYVVSGFLVGVAAVVTESRIMSASYKSLSDIHLDSIAAATVGGVSVYGGRGTILGVFLGTLILAVIDSGLGLLGATPDLQGTVKGTVILLAVSADYFSYGRRLTAPAHQLTAS